MDWKERLGENISRVRERIAAAAQRNGRKASNVTLVAVTKYVGTQIAQQLAATGCHDLGESRPQGLWAKAESIHRRAAELTNQPEPEHSEVRWHLIGHLQRNKIRRTLPLVSFIHSGDSLRLMEAVDQAAVAIQHRVPVLIEVNVSGESEKHGFRPEEVEPALPLITAFKSLEIRGLMCMASREGDLDQARREFAQLRQVRDRLQTVAPPGIDFRELSMGMSGDFEAAIEEGATIVRIGSALFEGAPESS
jgi:PLP dependent protein